MLIKRSASELSDGDDAGSRSPSMPTSPSKAALTTDPDVKPVFDTPTKSGKVKNTPKNTPTARSPAKKTGNHKADSPAAAGGKVANGGRLSADAKQVIAREIVRCGLTALDFAALERAVSETRPQGR